MRQQRYFPSRLSDQVMWLRNFADKLPSYREVLELSQEKLASLVADARYAAHVIGSWQPNARAFADSIAAAVREVLLGSGTSGLPVFNPPPLPDGVVVVPDGALERIFRFVQILKRLRGCTPAILTDLGIKPLGEHIERPVPRFSLKLIQVESGPAVQIGFFKYGHEGVWIESRRGDGAIEELGIAVPTPWLDQRALLIPGQPEMREYRLRFWDKGKPTGEWTPWRQIAVAG